ncbi:protein of unassigned function [Methylobacterium oryzae CBMB20]|uniref:Protein of unassigned function n=1 Tax=Methylobacterium oryzae CBMB20 TaxID=693986 RepID=A0A089NMK7_9HYPH|nr:protein of unassigned function [Methylobacterium oryzae CBMB20]
MYRPRIDQISFAFLTEKFFDAREKICEAVQIILNDASNNFGCHARFRGSFSARLGRPRIGGPLARIRGARPRAAGRANGGSENASKLGMSEC